MSNSNVAALWMATLNDLYASHASYMNKRMDL